jgi:hypothetical protein
MRLGTCLAGVLASLLTATLAEADGGALILREERGPWIVTLLAEPTPLREGPAVLEVLVQSAATGEPMLDADVRLRLTASGADHALEVQTHPDAAGNRLFRGARLYLPSPGPCQLEVLVTSSDHHETLRAHGATGPTSWSRPWALGFSPCTRPGVLRGGEAVVQPGGCRVGSRPGTLRETREPAQRATRSERAPTP